MRAVAVKQQDLLIQRHFLDDQIGAPVRGQARVGPRIVFWLRHSRELSVCRLSGETTGREGDAASKTLREIHLNPNLAPRTMWRYTNALKNQRLLYYDADIREDTARLMFLKRRPL